MTRLAPTGPAAPMARAQRWSAIPIWSAIHPASTSGTTHTRRLVAHRQISCGSVAPACSIVLRLIDLLAFAAIEREWVVARMCNYLEADEDATAMANSADRLS